LQAIIEKILSDAKEEARLIKEEAKKARKKILVETRKEAEELKQNLVEKGKKEVERQAEGLIREKKIELKKKKLEFKREKLEEVYRAALKKLLELKKKEKEKLYQSMILRLAKGGEEIIVSNSERSLIDQDFLTRLNRSLKKSGREPLKLSLENREIKGGFILKKDNLEVNASLEVLFNNLVEREAKKITQTLFGEEKK